MARKPLELPTGIDLRGDTIRIRFSWNGKRYSETAPFSPNQTGIASAARLRDQVTNLIKLNLFDEAKYLELFPNTTAIAQATVVNAPTFGEYAQIWLNSRSVTEGTRNNYKSCLNVWWMEHLAVTPVTTITPVLMRKLIAEIKWPTDNIKRNAMSRIATILDSVVSDGLLPENPMGNLKLPRYIKKDVDPFTREEAEKIIENFYSESDRQMQLLGAYFEFAFYTGMRPAEIHALRWDSVDLEKRTAHVKRVAVRGKIYERTKTKKERYVLLNERALKALKFARETAALRLQEEGQSKDLPFCFPLSLSTEFVTNATHLQVLWGKRLKQLKIRYRRPYNARHTYASMCLMAGMRPAFIAQQLGHSVQMLLSTYARWLNSQDDWAEMGKLQIGPKLVQERQGKE